MTKRKYNTHRRKTFRKGKGKRNTIKKTIRRRLRGGNYQRDVTTRQTEGIPTKDLNKFTVAVPGYGTMSGTAYKALMERIDRDGPKEYT